MASDNRISVTVSVFDLRRIEKGTIEYLEDVDVDYDPLGFLELSRETATPFSFLGEYHKALRELDKQFRNQKETKWGRVPALRKENV